MRYLNIFIIMFIGLFIFSCENNENVESNDNFYTGLLPKPSNYEQLPQLAYPPQGNLPSSHFLNLPNAGNQGSQGSCTAWAVAYGMQSYYRKNEFNLDYNNNTYCSPSFVYNQIKSGDCSRGSQISAALNLLQDQGVCSLAQMRYSASECNTFPNQQQLEFASENKISSWNTLHLDVSSFKNALNDGNPIVIAARLNDGFYDLENVNDHLVWNDNISNMNGYHAMVISGWDDDLHAFKALNSWGSHWGENGYVWIDYDLVGPCVDQAYIAFNQENVQLPPSLISPNNYSVDVNDPVIFSWEDLGGDAVYRIQVSKSLNDWTEEGFNNNSNLVVNTNTSSSNTYHWLTPEANTTYYWTVKTFKNNVSSLYSQPYRFTTNNSDNNTRVIYLSGSLSYGNVDVGEYNDRSLTITNNGNSTLDVNDISTPNGFSILENDSFSIAAGQHRTVTIRFQPQNASYYSGNITVYSNATSGNNSIAISGRGIQNEQTRIINLSGSLSYGNVDVGEYNDRSLTITNNGNSTLDVNDISTPNGFSILENNSFSIAAGQHRTVSIRFQPQNASYYSGNITVYSNATSGNNSIAISGRGIQNGPTYTITPDINEYSQGTEGTLHSDCTNNPNFPVNPNVIKLAVVEVTSSNISLRMEKVSSEGFQHNGNFYLKQNGICGTNLIEARPYNIGWTYLEDINIDNHLQPGESIILYGLIISNTTDRYYAGPITITRNN